MTGRADPNAGAGWGKVLKKQLSGKQRIERLPLPLTHIGGSRKGVRITGDPPALALAHGRRRLRAPLAV